MNVPDDRRYTKEHEWVVAAGEGKVRVGITDYAQDALGDVVYVELPEVGRTVTEGESIAEIESTKSVAEIYAPLAGTVVEVNEALVDAPEIVNRDAYGDGWFFVLEVDTRQDMPEMLDAAGYSSLVS